MHFLKSHVSDFKTIFDVGANIGEWTIEVAGLAPTAQIYSFEPSKRTFSTLQSNISKAHKTHPQLAHNAHLQNIGLGATREDKTFYIYGDDSTLNSTHQRAFETKETEVVRIDSLDQFCIDKHIDHIGFLKIDTEGNELNVLKGAHGMIKNAKIDAMQIEYGGTYIEARTLLKDVFELFKGTEYSIFKMFPNGIRRITEYSEQLENFQYANYLAIRNGFIK